MKNLTEYIIENREDLIVEKFSGDSIIEYDDQLIFKKQLNKDLGFSKNYNPKAKSEKSRLDQMKHTVAISFDSVSVYYTGPGEKNGYNLPVKLGKSTYNQIKNAVAAIYKEMEEDLEKYGYEIPNKIKEMW